MNEKLCKHCKQLKAVDEFHSDKDGKYGVKAKCKACQSDLNKNYYRNNAAKIRKQQKYYYRKFIEKKKITIKKDGKFWCILWGGDLMEGVAGYGTTIDKAMVNFAKEILDPKRVVYIPPENIELAYTKDETGIKLLEVSLINGKKDGK